MFREKTDQVRDLAEKSEIVGKKAAESAKQKQDLQIRLARLELGSTSDGDRSPRQHQRGIKTLQNQILSLEDELKVQDEEILKLKSAIPLPPDTGEPSNEEAQKLMDQVESLRVSLQKAELDLEEQHALGAQNVDTHEAAKKEMDLIAFGLRQEKQAVAEEVQRLEEALDLMESRAAEAGNDSVCCPAEWLGGGPRM